MKFHNIILRALATVLLFGNLGCAHNIVHEHTIADYKQECDRLISKSCNKLGDIYLKGVDAERNLNLAKKYYENACDLDNGDSCNTLGEWYLSPRIYHIEGIQRDPVKAKELFEIGCKNMHAKSCTNLGRLYLSGKDNAIADLKFAFGCDLHDGDGCKMRAYMFSRGLNGPTDLDAARKYERKAIKSYKAACDKDDGEECKKLGYFYFKEQNYEEAYSYAISACYLDNSSGCELAGFLAQDKFRFYAEALRYYGKACALYGEEGCASIGSMYEMGDGIQKDKRMAKAYYKLACDIVKKGWFPDYCEKVEELTDQGY